MFLQYVLLPLSSKVFLELSLDHSELSNSLKKIYLNALCFPFTQQKLILLLGNILQNLHEMLIKYYLLQEYYFLFARKSKKSETYYLNGQANNSRRLQLTNFANISSSLNFFLASSSDQNFFKTPKKKLWEPFIELKRIHFLQKAYKGVHLLLVIDN